jgi:Domain of unknown function (DUF4406)
VNQTKAYLAGPMESVGGNWNLPLFDYVSKKLREKGIEVFSPAELNRDDARIGKSISKEELQKLRKQSLKIELNWIIEHADWVLLLPGWERSPGAKAEVATATAIGLRTYELPNIILPTDETEFSKDDSRFKSLAQTLTERDERTLTERDV